VSWTEAVAIVMTEELGGSLEHWLDYLERRHG